MSGDLPPIRFCDLQLYAIGNSISALACAREDKGARLFCCAYLAEGRAFPCPYHSENIRNENGVGKIYGSFEGEERECCDFIPFSDNRGKEE